MDSDAETLRPHFEKLKQLGTFGLSLPQENGNPIANEKDFLLNDSLLAEYSGALCFLQTQYRGALSRLSDPLLTACQNFYEKLNTHQYTTGISVVNEHLVQVQQQDNQLILNGTLPWVSGYTFLDYVVIFLTADDTLYQLYIPFKDIHTTQGNISCSPPLKTIVFNSINTVKIILKNWVVEKEYILSVETKATVNPIRIPSAAHFFIGTTRSLLKLIKESRQFKNPELQQQHIMLEKQLDEFTQKVLNANINGDILRAQGRQLAEASATLARLAYGGTALS